MLRLGAAPGFERGVSGVDRQACRGVRCRSEVSKTCGVKDDEGVPNVYGSGSEVSETCGGPFGEDAGQRTPDGALDNGLFLRLRGQWEDRLWADAGGSEVSETCGGKARKERPRVSSEVERRG